MEEALGGLSVKFVLSESSENLSDVLPVFLQGVGVNQNVVEVHDNTVVEHVAEDVVHEALERGRSVRQAFGND